MLPAVASAAGLIVEHPGPVAAIAARTADAVAVRAIRRILRLALILGDRSGWDSHWRGNLTPLENAVKGRPITPQGCFTLGLWAVLGGPGGFGRAGRFWEGEAPAEPLCFLQITPDYVLARREPRPGAVKGWPSLS